jgi:hypothetical protein
MSSRKSSPKAGPSRAGPSRSAAPRSELSSRERAEREAAAREKALKTLVQHYTANPDFKDVLPMQTLASTNKEYSKIWKDMLPSMKTRFPTRVYSQLFVVPSDYTGLATELFTMDICVLGRSKPMCVDSCGETVFTLTEYQRLRGDPDARTRLNWKFAENKRKNVIGYILRNAQFGDMYQFKGIRYVVVDEPALNKACVAPVPQMNVEMDASTLCVFLLPVACTQYMVKYGIAPLASKKQLALAPIAGAGVNEPIALSATNSLLAEYGKAECKNQRSMILNPRQTTNGAVVSADTKYQLILFQHPSDPSIFFDVSGTLFKAESPHRFQLEKPIDHAKVNLRLEIDM